LHLKGGPVVSVRNADAGSSAGTGERPFGVVLASAVDGLRMLARKHVELARIEAAEAAGVRGQGMGVIAAAAVVAMYAVGFIAAAGAAALALAMPLWAAILIVGVLLILVAGVLLLVARRTLRTAPPVGERTRTTMKEDALWAKQQIAR
jgi:MFS family permease